MVNGTSNLEKFTLPHGFLDRPESEVSQIFADFLSNEPEKVADVPSLAAKLLTQAFVLSGHADRAGVEVASPQHAATTHPERRGSESELSRPQKHRHHDIATGLELPSGLDHDAVAQTVQ